MCVCVDGSADVHICVCLREYVHMRASWYLHIPVYTVVTNMYMHMQIHTRTHTHAHTHTRTRTHIQTHTYIATQSQTLTSLR